MTETGRYTIPFGELRAADVARVGGKNASLGEMIQMLKKAGIRVPDGFATTASAYWAFVEHNDLRERLAEAIKKYQRGKVSLAKTGRAVRGLFLKGEMPPEIAESISAGYRELGKHRKRRRPDVAVRSSARRSSGRGSRSGSTTSSS